MSTGIAEPARTIPPAGTKRPLPVDENNVSNSVSTATELERPAPASPPLNSSTATSAFRNVSACNRCRVRKNRCDQVLPACSACTKANVRCVGYDPITKREIPRSYVYYLETRLSYFEDLLKSNQITYDAAEIYDADSRILGGRGDNTPTGISHPDPVQAPTPFVDTRPTQQEQEDQKLDNLVSNIGMVSVQGTSDHRYLGATSGISFARVVLSAVKRSVPANNGDRSSSKLTKSAAAIATGGESMRDSYFGIQTRSPVKEAPFPDRELGEKLVTLYFEYANPQIPILHRDDFLSMFDRAYSVSPEQRTPRELYLLNIVYAIGAGTLLSSSEPEPNSGQYTSKRARLDGQQAQPEEYHAAACVHLTSFLNSSGHANPEQVGSVGASDLDELQAVLLLAGFALLRPIAPGLWYIVGVAMRLAIDLGLHYEDGTGLTDSDVHSHARTERDAKKVQQLGRRQWTRDLRRRLWWCTYAFDRLVSTCVGRPLGITDQVITTEFPSLVDDKHITQEGIAQDISTRGPSYKLIAHHYLRLRLLQSEIVQVLQYEQAQMTRVNGLNRHNDFMHTKLQSPFLIKHKSFRTWRKDIDQRLFEWKESAPHREDTGVSFSPQFLELNYWQAVTMLYRQSLSVPPPFAGELSPTEDVTSPSSVFTEDKEDEDLVFLKCAEAGQKTLKIYRQLHRLRLVNYTYLATHHLFMAGISFLYAVWHSPAVRSRITLDDFDFTVLAATSVLGDLIAKCPPAEACRDAFERMSKATVQMCMSSPAFGFGSREESHRTFSDASMVNQNTSAQHVSSGGSMSRPSKRPPPKFDLDLRDLFPDGVNNLNKTRPAARPRSSTQRSHRKSRGSISRKASHPQDIYGPSPMQYDAQVHDADLGMMQGSSRGYHTPGMQSITSPTFQSQPTYHMETTPNSYNPDFMSNLPGMDFLNQITDNANSQASQFIENHPSLPQSSSIYQRDSGLEDSWLDVSQSANADGDGDSDWGLGSGFGVGVGMGLDFGPNHDWSDGQGGLNMFDGFFFGGGGDDGGGGGTNL